MYTQENLNGLNKPQLIDIILKLQETQVTKNGRKEQVLAALLDGPKTLLEIQEFIGDASLDTRNISSQLTYIKKTHPIMHFPDGRRFIPGQTKGCEAFQVPAMPEVAE